MKTIFSDEFKKELAIIGSSIKVRAYTLGLYKETYESRVTDEGVFVKDYLSPTEDLLVGNTTSEGYTLVDSLWNEETETLSISLDLDEIPEESEDEKTVVILYYSDLNDDIIGVAGWCIPDVDVDNRLGSLNLSTTTHIMIPIVGALCNIVGQYDDETITFLESPTNTEGINMFLAADGYVESEKPVTKLSYKRYKARESNKIVEKPLYLDENGEKVYSISYYKHYKSITISSSNNVGKEDSNGDLLYYVGNGTSSIVVGTCIYDLYQASNNNYVLVESDKQEDLTYAVLEELTGLGGYTFSNNEKIIKFDSEDSSDKEIKFRATLSFRSELGDTKGSVITLTSNTLSFHIYFKWTVEYSTNLTHEDGEALILFDTNEGSMGWNPDYSSGGTSGEIIIYSEKNVSPSTIVVQSDSGYQTYFDNYFGYNVEAGGYDTTNRKYKYTLTLYTKQSSAYSSSWFPLDSTGASVEFCNRVVIENGESAEEVKFHCVQRPGNTLKIVDSTGNEVSSLDVTANKTAGLIGTSEYWITGQADGYSTWEVDKETLSFDGTKNVVFLSKSTGSIVDDVREEGTGFNVYYRECDNSDLTIASLKFRRVKSTTKGYDPTNWRDLIYCHPSLSIPFTLQHTGISNPLITDSSNYYEGEYMLIFDRGNSETKTIKVLEGYSIAEVVKSDDELVDQYFTISYSSDKVSIKVSNQTYSDNYGWYPSDKDGAPAYITVKYSRVLGDVIFTGEESIRLAIRPVFKGTINLNSITTTEQLSSIDLQKKDEIFGVYVSSTTEKDTSVCDYWTTLFKDSEVKMSWDNRGVSSGSRWKLIATDEPVDNWDNEDQLKPFVSFYTNTSNTDNVDYDFDPLIIRRSKIYYSNLVDLYSDWEEQLYEGSITTIPMTLKGTGEVDELSVFGIDSSSNLVEISKVELDYIGIYRIFIKSSGKFRVSLVGNNKSDGFYFYDIDTDTPKRNILMQDEASFDPYGGREVCFVYYGGEEDCFRVKEQTLSTYIKVELIGDDKNGPVRIPLHRTYFKDDTTKEAALWTNINEIDSPADRYSNIFITSDSYDRELKYRSNLETIVGNESSLVKLTEGITTIYNAYSTKSSYVKNGTTYEIPGRGYQYHSLLMDLSGLSENINYPISHSDIITIKNPDSPYSSGYGLNSEMKTYNIYRLPPTPGISLSLQGRLELSYNGSATAVFKVKTDTGSSYKVRYCEEGTDTWYTYTSGECFSGSGTNSGSASLFTIQRTPSNDSDGWEAYTITEGTGANRTDQDGGDLSIGYIQAYSYVPKDDFLSDYDVNYTQIEVDALVGNTETGRLQIVRRDENHSSSTLTGDTTLVSKYGETRIYELNIKESEVYNESATEEKNSNASSVVYDSELRKLSLTYPSRIKGLSPVSLSWTSSSGSYKCSAQDTMVGLTRQLDVSPVAVVSDRQITLKENTYQEEWTTALRFSNGSSQKLYLGDGESSSNIFRISVSATAGYATFYLSGVYLPTSTTLGDSDYSMTLQDGLPVCISSGDVPSYINSIIIDKYSEYSSYGHWGYKYTVTLPINDSATSTIGPYNMVFSDPSGENKLTVSITVGKKTSFKVVAFDKVTKESDGTYSVSSENEVSDLVFSASGYLRYPCETVGSKGKIYLLTDAPNSEVSPRLSISVRSIEGVSSLSTVTTQYFDASVSYTYLGDCTWDGGEAGKTYSIYELTPYVKINKWSKASANTNSSSGFAHNPYKCECTLYLSSNNYYNTITFNSYHGCCSIELVGPYMSYNSVETVEAISEEESVSTITSTLAAFSSTVTPDFGTYDTDEISKYTSNSSYFLSNTKPGTGYYSNYVQCDNTVVINYTESDTNKKWSADFDAYGYFPAFRIKVMRKEWNPDGSGGYEVVDLIKKGTTIMSTYEGMGIREGYGNKIEVYHDHMYPRQEGVNPETITIVTKGTSSLTSSTGKGVVTRYGKVTLYPDIIEDIDSTLGILFDYDSGEFTTSSNVKSNTTHSLTISQVSSDDYSGDEVQFTFTTNLYNV